ncbi:MAG: glycosyltransferase family 39 protein [Acidobacteria bacterium]|nr:glycosyltransferase family 39 protein [Acidobacteriota bacterium]
MSQTPERRASLLARVTPLAPVLLLATFATLASVSLTLDSPTFDEPTHLLAGVSYLQTGDFRLNPEHPPLAKMWAALPLVASGVEHIDPTAIRWRRARQREMGFEFVNGRFEDRQRLDPNARLVPARLAMVAVGLLLLGVIYLWSRELWGPRGGRLSLVLAALSPTMLAHSRLVTTDVPAALGFAATLWCFWRFCRNPSLARALALGVVLGSALLVKFSTVMLPPMLIGLLAVWVIVPPAGNVASWTRLRRLTTGIGALALAAVVSVAVVWAGYGFRYKAMRTPDAVMDWPAPSDTLQRSLTWVRHSRLLPEAYLYGISYVLSKADRRTFLNGRILEHGSHLYFAEAFALKSTPALLAFSAWLLWRAVRGRWSFDGWSLFIPIAVYGLVAVLSPLNIGHRHLLPVYAWLFIALGALASGVQTSRVATIAMAFLIAAHALSSASAFPRYLAYFNVLAGGSARGWHYLVDSNIDWGQDMRRLRAWMDENAVPRIYLAYFGSADPATYGIRYRPIVMVEDFEERRPAYPEPSEYFAVSVTLLQGLYVTSPEVGQWLRHVRDEMTPVDRAGDSLFIYRMPAR